MDINKILQRKFKWYGNLLKIFYMWEHISTYENLYNEQFIG